MPITKATYRVVDFYDNTDSLDLPKGTTAQRPTSPVVGMIRQNTDDNVLEYYDGTEWKQIASTPPTVNMEYVAVAGGGSGNKGFINNSGSTGGGGGAGGLSYGTIGVVGTLTIVVGAGATWVQVEDTSAGGSPTNLSTSTLNIDLVGGGGGGMQSRVGGDGGSGGGAQGGAGGQHPNPGSGTALQGNDGGVGSPSNYQSAGGGGGYSSAGTIGTPGSGYQTSITGSLITLATGGVGGTGTTNGSNASANTGDGGNGGGGSSSNIGGNGGSGVVILKILTTEYSGNHTGSPEVIVDGEYTILRYTSSGTYIS